jgi:hypothetical protein
MDCIWLGIAHKELVCLETLEESPKISLSQPNICPTYYILL